MKLYYFTYYYLIKIGDFLQRLFKILFSFLNNFFLIFKKQVHLLLQSDNDEKEIFLLSYILIFCCLISVVFFFVDFAKPKDSLVVVEHALVKEIEIDKSVACLSCMDAYAMEIEAKPEDFLELYLVKDISFL